MAELQELKEEISQLGRSLDGSTISFVLRQRDGPRNGTATAPPAEDILAPTTVDGHFSSSPRRNRRIQNPPLNDPIGGARRRPLYANDQGGSKHVPTGHSSECSSDYELDIRFPPPAPPRAPVRAASVAAAAAETCKRGVQADYDGVRDVGQLVRRVEASARSVSRENEDIIKSLRKEEDKTARLRDALWQEGTAKRDWEITTEASRVLRQRLESTERIRKRQKELIMELQAVEADIAFANAGGMAGAMTAWPSQAPLPLLSPPLPPPPSPSRLPTSAARPAKAPTPSRLTLRRDRTAEGEKRARGRNSGDRRVAGNPQGRRRRSRPARDRTAGNAAVGGHRRARVKHGGEIGGGGGDGGSDDGVERRPLPTTAPQTKTCFTSRVTCRADADSTTAADRRASRSNSARRPRVSGGDAAERVSTNSKRRQGGNGAHERGGGGDAGRRRPRGHSNASSFSTGRAEIIARSERADRRPESAAAALTAAPRSRSRLRATQPVRVKSARPAAAEAQERARQRSAPKASVVSSVARCGFWAPTAASSGKDRRREGVVTAPEKQRAGATPRAAGLGKS
eukprot:g13026.t1